MTRFILVGGILAALTLSAGIAQASYGPTAADAVLVNGQATQDNQVARRGRGQDDGPGHTRRCRGCDDGPNHTMQDNDQYDQMARRGRGADDAAGHMRRGRGADDGPNHS